MDIFWNYTLEENDNATCSLEVSPLKFLFDTVFNKTWAFYNTGQFAYLQ